MRGFSRLNRPGSDHTLRCPLFATLTYSVRFPAPQVTWTATYWSRPPVDRTHFPEKLVVQCAIERSFCQRDVKATKSSPEIIIAHVEGSGMGAGMRVSY